MKCGFERNKDGHCFNDQGKCIVCGHLANSMIELE
jgi:hypothetical protein